MTCTSCHDYVGMAVHTRSSAQAADPLACSACHGSWRPLGHFDGTVQLTSDVNCTRCHGTFSTTPSVPRDAAPPVDVYGGSDVNRVGAHAAHLDGKTWSNGFSCGTCHSGAGSYVLADHFAALDGAADLVFTGLGAGTVYEADRTCSSSYCHGGTLTGGATPAPAWSGAIACNACHGIAPATGKHTNHTSVPCGTCHAGYSATAVDTSLHVNGTVNAIPTTGCHCTGTW